MANCNGNCASCSGCARELVLTEMEIDFLRELGQIPFLPVARKMGDLTPVYLEAGEDRQAHQAQGQVDQDGDRPPFSPQNPQGGKDTEGLEGEGHRPQREDQPGAEDQQGGHEGHIG